MKIIQVGEFVCKVGETAQENWDLLDKARKHHWFFHLTDFPSPYVVLECDKQEPNAHVREHCAEICLEHSKYKGQRKIKVDATPCSNVKVDKKDEVGECDYKNEAKVEIIVPQGGKKAGKSTEEGNAGGDAPAKGRGRGKGGYADKAAGGAKCSVGHEAAAGVHATVQKSERGGWATVTFRDASVRNAVLRQHAEICVGAGVTVSLQPQVDPKTKEEVPTAIFASWGRKVEEKSPVSQAELLRCFEELGSRAAAALERVAPSRAAGERVSVRKAAVGGCAVIAFRDAETRNAILAAGREISVEPGVTVKLNPQVDPKTKEEIPTELFAAWGRKVEEKTPVSEADLLRRFEELCQSFGTGAKTAPDAEVQNAEDDNVTDEGS